METLLTLKPLPSGLLGTKAGDSQSTGRAYLKRICRLRFSFFRMTLDQRSRAASHPFGMLALREGAA